MRTIAAALAVAVAGCASSPGTVPNTTRDVGFGSSASATWFEFVPDQAVRTDTLQIYPAQAWAVVARAYADVGLPPGTAQEGMRTYGVPRMTLRRELSGTPLARFVSCGATMGIPNANTYDVTLSVISRLTGFDQNKTIVQTQIRAFARPTGVSANPITCSTTMELERRIANLIEHHGTRGT